MSPVVAEVSFTVPALLFALAFVAFVVAAILVPERRSRSTLFWLAVGLALDVLAVLVGRL